MRRCALVALGCGTGRPLHQPPPGDFYVVRAGESLQDIAHRQNVPLEDLAEINGLPADAPLAAGQVVFVLQARGVVPASSPDILPPSVLDDGDRPGDDDRPEADTSGRPLAWPVRDVVISSAYGKRWGRAHEGIDLAAPKGTPVFAAREGTVLYASDKLSGYGKMVVLQHDGDLLTAYAHNSSLLVREGDKRAGRPDDRPRRPDRPRLGPAPALRGPPRPDPPEPPAISAEAGLSARVGLAVGTGVRCSQRASRGTANPGAAPRQVMSGPTKWVTPTSRPSAS